MIDDASEDDQLAAAIAASLENGHDASDADETKMEESDEEEEEEEAFQALEPEPAGTQSLHWTVEWRDRATVWFLTLCVDGTPGVIRVQVRAPDGSRLTRRFLKTDPMATLWRFVKEQVLYRVVRWE